MSGSNSQNGKRNGMLLSNPTRDITSIDFDDILNKLVDDTHSIPLNETPLYDGDGTENIADELNTRDDVLNKNNEMGADNVVIENENGGNFTSLEQKVDVMVLNNGWNDKNERIIISIGENAASYKWMHERCSAHYKMINRILGIIMILFSTGLSAETILPNEDNNLVINILRRIFTYVITFISVLQNFLKYEQLSEQHMSAASDFSQLYHAIQQQMCMYRRDRTNATNYVADVLKKYDSLVVNSPDINNVVVTKFKEAFKNAEISIPDIADRIQKIEIISEPIEKDVDLNIKGIGNEMVGNNTTQNNNISQYATKDTSKRYGRQGLCNLEEIHSVFQIHGDISDKDIEKADSNQLREIRKKFLREMGNYEYKRYMEHE